MRSRQLTKFLASFAASMMDAEDSLETVRAKMAQIHPTDHGPDTTVERLEIAGLECAWVTTPETDPSRTVFFVHGGAFVSTGIAEYMRFAGTVATLCKARVLVPQYSLAPESVHPMQLDELSAVYRSAGLTPERTAFMGDSCGGGMAISFACRLRDAGDPLPACIVGLTPWLNARADCASAVEPRGVDPFLNAAWVRARYRDYVGPEADPALLDAPSVSPLRAELNDLPPIFLGVGTTDTLCDDATALAARLAAAEREVVLDVVAGHIHGLHGLVGMCPESDRAMRRVGEFVETYIP